jgi:hypothetical protein
VLPKACTPFVAALQRSQADTLLMTGGFDSSDRDAGYGAEPTRLAVTDPDLEAMGVEPRRGPVADVVLRAAVGTGARVVVVSDDVGPAPAKGVGALLRYELSAA